MSGHDWMTHAACRGATELFYTDAPSQARKAQAICATCPVQTECADYARINNEQHGIWGGMDVRQRRNEANRRRRAAAGLAPLRTIRQPVAVHGTDAGYMAHRRRAEPACAPCTAAHANAARHREYQQKDSA